MIDHDPDEGELRLRCDKCRNFFGLVAALQEGEQGAWGEQVSELRDCAERAGWSTGTYGPSRDFCPECRDKATLADVLKNV
jgi:hypothetical protein